VKRGEERREEKRREEERPDHEFPLFLCFACATFSLSQERLSLGKI